MKDTYRTLVVIVVSALILSIGAVQAQPPSRWVYLYNAQHTGMAADAVDVPLSLSWRCATGESGKAVSTPAVGPDRVYFARGTKLYAVERATGAQVWSTELNTQVYSALVLEGDTLYFGATDGKLWAVDTAGGAAKWKYASEGPIRSAPVIDGGIVYFGSDDKRLYGFDLATDQPLQPFQTSGAIQSTPAIWKDNVFVASQDGYIYALKRSAAGFRMVWQAQATVAYGEMFSSPVVHRGQVLISASNRLIGFDATRGTRRWNFKAGGLIAGSPAVTGRRAYIGSRDGVIYCVDVTQGKALWRFPIRGSRGPIQSSPVLAGDVLLVRSGPPQVAAQLQQRATAGPLETGRGGPASTIQQPIAQTFPASILALDPQNGDLIWEYRLQKAKASIRPGGGQYAGYGSAGPEMPGAEFGRPGASMQPGGAPNTGGLGEGGTTATTGLDRYAQYVDASVVAAQGSAYIVGDDGALYGLDAGAQDNEKPSFKETTITFPGPQAGTEYSLAISNESAELFFPPPPAEKLLQIPGSPPLRVATEVSDSGSGIDPESVQILIDGQAVPDEQIFYQPIQSLVWWIYEPEAAMAMARNYPAGCHTLEIKVSDGHGNQGGVRTYFVIDNSLTTPKIPGVPQQPYGYGPGGGLGGGPPMPGLPGGYGTGMPPGH